MTEKSTKHCYMCKTHKPRSCFHKNSRKYDGLASECKDCVKAKNQRLISEGVHRERYKKSTSTPEGAATYAWYRLTTRVRLAEKRHNLRAYRSVRILMTRSEFMDWAVPAYKDWFEKNPGVTPSLDRRDSSGHYTIDNLQLITLRKNSHKARRNIHLHHNIQEGMKLCGRCQSVKPFSDYHKVKPGATGTFGLFGWCKECTRAYDQQRSKNPRRQIQIKARGALVSALKKGLVVKKTHCEAPECTRSDVQAHHHLGYARENWIDVIWLCPKHHSQADHQLESLGRVSLASME